MQVFINLIYFKFVMHSNSKTYVDIVKLFLDNLVLYEEFLLAWI